MQLHELFRTVFKYWAHCFNMYQRQPRVIRMRENKEVSLYPNQPFSDAICSAIIMIGTIRSRGWLPLTLIYFFACLLSSDRLSPAILEASLTDEPIHNPADHNLTFFSSFLLCYDINSSLPLNLPLVVTGRNKRWEFWRWNRRENFWKVSLDATSSNGSKTKVDIKADKIRNIILTASRWQSVVKILVEVESYSLKPFSFFQCQNINCCGSLVPNCFIS